MLGYLYDLWVVELCILFVGLAFQFLLLWISCFHYLLAIVVSCQVEWSLEPMVRPWSSSRSRTPRTSHGAEFGSIYAPCRSCSSVPARSAPILTISGKFRCPSPCYYYLFITLRAMCELGVGGIVVVLVFLFLVSKGFSFIFSFFFFVYFLFLFSSSGQSSYEYQVLIPDCCL